MNEDSNSLYTKWKIGTSSSFFQGITEKNLEDCKAAGIDCIEITLFGKWFDINRTNMESYCSRLAEKGKSLGIEFWSVHLPFGDEWDISVPDKKKRNEIIHMHSSLIKFAQCFNPQKAVIHASYEPIENESRCERIAACRESLSVLSEKADQLGIQLAVECLPRTCIGNTIAEMNQLVEGIDLLGVCCDTNHLLTDKTENFIKSLGRKIVTLHVSDYDRVNERHWLPGKGINNWNAIIEELEHIGYNGPIMFEVSNANIESPMPPQDLRKCWDKISREFTNSKGK